MDLRTRPESLTCFVNDQGQTLVVKARCGEFGTLAFHLPAGSYFYLRAGQKDVALDFSTDPPPEIPDDARVVVARSDELGGIVVLDNQ